ncbi:MAG: energy-coupled thiamine transporter ThiT [Coriobacteriia bacterium]|nr:energy-coupled thiamine transporter ThiT [Coriobacteriia bacterium]
MSKGHISGSNRVGLVAEVGLSIALAVVLGMLKVWQMPQGGEISLAMLPLLVLAFRRGAGPAMLAGALYGVLDAQLNPFIVHWAQYILDYPLAYALVGLAGLAAGRLRALPDRQASVRTLIVAGTVLGTFGRYVAHTVSGVIFFAEYAGPGQPVLLYSAGYNSFVLVSAAACAVAAVAIVPALSRVVPVRKEVSP